MREAIIATILRWKLILLLAVGSALCGKLMAWLSDVTPPYTGWIAGPVVTLLCAIMLGCCLFGIIEEVEEDD